jgi:hypothetical protein
MDVETAPMVNKNVLVFGKCVRGTTDFFEAGPALGNRGTNLNPTTGIGF